ncbi:MAG: hypothetical protein K9I68_02400 [Bacteroidales bacterium]|nr:hypothetical protein [Bacteroidales bacterium]MCF8338604.1 hypothetical protein [Bacteroidales bacterium]
MLKKIFYATPAVLGAALFLGGLGMIGQEGKTGEVIFMLIVGAVFLYVSYRNLYTRKNKDNDAPQSGSRDDDLDSPF